jgi:hypothetical protein
MSALSERFKTTTSRAAMRLFGIRPDEDKTPTEGEKAGHGSGQVSAAYIGDVTARIGTYAPDKVRWATKRKMEKDPHIKACSALNRLAILSQRWDVDGPDPEVVEFVRAALEPVWVALVRSCSDTGVNEGCAAHELVWQRREITLMLHDDAGNETEKVVTGWVTAKVKDIDPSSIQSILVDGLEEFAGYRLTYPNITLEAEKCFHYTEGMRFGNYWGEGRLVAAYDPWYAHAILQSLYLRFADRKSVPAVHVSYPAGEDSEGNKNSDTARLIAQGFQSDGTAFWTPVSDGIDAAKWAIELIGNGTQNVGTASIFTSGMAMLQTRMMLALLTPEKVLEGSGGSLALASAHKDVWMLGVSGTFEQIIEAVNDQIVPRIVRYTFGADVPVPRVVPGGITDETESFLGGLFTEMVKVGGVNVDADSIAERLGVPTTQGESASSGVEAAWRGESVRLADELHGARLTLAAAMH